MLLYTLLYTLLILYILYVLILNSRDKDHSKISDQGVRKLVRQISRWSLASEQDQNPFIAVLHANYGVGYLSALLELTNECEIERITGIDMVRFSTTIHDIQDTASKRLFEVCPNYQPSNRWLAKIGVEY